MKTEDIAQEFEVLTAEKEHRRQFLKGTAGVIGASAFTALIGNGSAVIAATSEPLTKTSEVIVARCNLLSKAAQTQDMSAAIKEFGTAAQLSRQQTQQLKRITANELLALKSINDKIGPANAGVSAAKDEDRPQWLTSW